VDSRQGVRQTRASTIKHARRKSVSHTQKKGQTHEWQPGCRPLQADLPPSPARPWWRRDDSSEAQKAFRIDYSPWIPVPTIWSRGSKAPYALLSSRCCWGDGRRDEVVGWAELSWLVEAQPVLGLDLLGRRRRLRCCCGQKKGGSTRWLADCLTSGCGRARAGNRTAIESTTGWKMSRTVAGIRIRMCWPWLGLHFLVYGQGGCPGWALFNQGMSVLALRQSYWRLLSVNGTEAIAS